MTNQKIEKESIRQTLKAYAEAYCSKDIEAMMQVFDNSNNISVIGTGVDELCVGTDQVRALFLNNFEEATAKKFECDWVDIRMSNDHAIASVVLKIHLDYRREALQIPIRWSVVLKKEKNNWVWIHRNASVAASNQDEGQSYPKEK